MKRTTVQRKRNALEKAIKKQQKTVRCLIRDLQKEDTLYSSWLENKKNWKLLPSKKNLVNIFN